MQKSVDLSFLDEPVEEDAAELLRALPEFRHEVAFEPDDDDLGLRSLLERPEAFSHAWWRGQATRSASRNRSRPHSAPWRAA
jgi:hypothetical protein